MYIMTIDYSGAVCSVIQTNSKRAVKQDAAHRRVIVTREMFESYHLLAATCYDILYRESTKDFVAAY